MSEGKELSHAQVWDDTDLVDSWNEAYEEYKHYHSLHARGEMVEDILRAEEEVALNGNEDHIMDGELDEPINQKTGAFETGVIEPSEIRQDFLNDTPLAHIQIQGPAQSSNVKAEPIPSLVSMPHALLGSGSDEALKNLMMSWYYAGYYTGLHEGQQKALQNHVMPSQGIPDPTQQTTETMRAS